MKVCTILLAVAVMIGAATSVCARDQLNPKEMLGKALFFDKISDPKNQSCGDCHGPSVGFTGDLPGINLQHGIYRGAVPQRFGNRKPPSNAYITFAPVFHYDGMEFIGGNFWDGRATGELLGNPAADQALGPFLAPVEQNMPSKMAVVRMVSEAKYAWLFEMIWGEPISYATPTDVEKNYDRIGLAIAAYEGSNEVNKFTSKFDLYWNDCLNAGNDPEDCGLAEGPKEVLDPNNVLTEQEFDGLIEFGEYCSPCHVSHMPGPGGVPPLFTDFRYDNIGVPRNPANPFYDMDEVYLGDGSPINPLGEDFVDFGLGDFLRSRPEWEALAAENDGKFKIPTVRNVDKRPGNGFPKAFMHNGVFKTLEEVVHFYNTRDVPAENWPPPEVPENVNREIFEGVPLGNLELDAEAEAALVAFLGTLSDDFKRKPPVVVSNTTTEVKLDLSGPNPFNPSTTIDYSLPTKSQVTLHVYNVAGQRVARLVEGWRDAGDHRATFNADNLPSGVYFLQLKAGDTTLTRKAVLLK